MLIVLAVGTVVIGSLMWGVALHSELRRARERPLGEESSAYPYVDEGLRWQPPKRWRPSHLHLVQSAENAPEETR